MKRSMRIAAILMATCLVLLGVVGAMAETRVASVATKGSTVLAYQKLLEKNAPYKILFIIVTEIEAEIEGKKYSSELKPEELRLLRETMPGYIKEAFQKGSKGQALVSLEVEECKVISFSEIIRLGSERNFSIMMPPENLVSREVSSRGDQIEYFVGMKDLSEQIQKKAESVNLTLTAVPMPDELIRGWWGLGSYGYGTVRMLDDERWLQYDADLNPHPAEVFVHEGIHSLEFQLDYDGQELADIDMPFQYGIPSTINYYGAQGWMNLYNAILGGELEFDGENVSVTQDRWWLVSKRFSSSPYPDYPDPDNPAPEDPNIPDPDPEDPDPVNPVPNKDSGGGGGCNTQAGVFGLLVLVIWGKLFLGREEVD